MNLLQNGVIAMLAAVGLSTLVWLVVSTVIGRSPRRETFASLGA